MTDDLLHGGALDRMRRAFPDASLPWVDLSTGINPWPYPAAAPSAAALHHLPTREALDACREAMGKAFGAPPAAVLPVPGSELAIRLLPLVLRADHVAALAPAYADHARAWRAHGRTVVETHDPLASNADTVVLVSPNNPDGRRFDADAIEAARRRLAPRGGTVIVDEAYADLDPGASCAPLAGRPGLVVLRSTGKFYGLAGLRLGAVLADADTLARLAALLGVWCVSGPALELGAAVYRDTGWQEGTRAGLSRARRRTDDLLRAAGIEAVGGTDLYRYVRADDAGALWHRLAEDGVYVRRFDWSERHLRLGLPADAKAEARLADALARFASGGPRILER